jgi:hypothetical protein
MKEKNIYKKPNKLSITVKCSDDEFIDKVNNLHDKIYSNVRIAKIWNMVFYKDSDATMT